MTHFSMAVVMEGVYCLLYCINLHFNVWYVVLTAIELTPVAVVQYTFTHKQYTEQHNGTEHTEHI